MIYYNEIDPKKAADLRTYIAAGLVAKGDVDERSIAEVKPRDLRGYTQCHWFAGIGVWSYALRLAGWPDDRPVWTGSCPCQPFSVAGRRKAFGDPRHLWPHWFRLIAALKPGVVFGEQSASKSALAWLDLVFDDMEGADYTVWAADIGAPIVGAPHIRQRFYFVADAAGPRRQRRRSSETCDEPGAVQQLERLRDAGRMADADGRISGDGGLQRSGQHGQQPKDGRSGKLGNAAGPRLEGWQSESGDDGTQLATVERPGGAVSRLAQPDDPERRTDLAGSSAIWAGPVNGFWRTADWIFCRDEKWRPIKSGLNVLAHGSPARVRRLRNYGDSIVAPLAAAFIEAYLEAKGEVINTCSKTA